MKKLFKPASLLFNLLTLLAFFVLGLLFAGWIEAGKGQMLAGGAIVLGYGVLFAGVALVASFFLTYYAKHRIIVIGNIILALFLLAAFGYFRYRFNQKQQERDRQQKEVERPKKPTKPADNGKLLALNKLAYKEQVQPEKAMGLGFFAPNFYENPVLHFYGHTNLEKSVQEHVPIDSIVFQRLEQGGFEIAQAPPWLVPEHMKLDYDMLYFGIKSLGREFVEIIVNEQTQRTAYVNKYEGRIIHWPEFLMGVHSVEFSSGSNKKVKVRPFEVASDVMTSFSFMRPILVQQNWMKVDLWNDGFEKVGEGWIQWQKEGRLLVTYNLLS